MKIVLYFSTLLWMLWLIHEVLSHDVAKHNTVKQSNGSEDGKSEYLLSQPVNLQEKVLIKPEARLRGRKIHHTAWSKEESNEEKSQESKQPEKKIFELNSWTLENLLKYVMSFIKNTEETEQPSHSWITFEDLNNKLIQNNKKNQKTNEKNDDRIFNDIQKNNGKEYSLKFRKGYLEDQDFNKKQTETEIENVSEESYKNSYESEGFRLGEEQVDKNRIHFKRIKTLHNMFQERENEKSHSSTKPDESSSILDDENEDSTECSEDESSEDSEEIEDEKTIWTKNIFKSNDMKQSNEEHAFVLNKKYVINKDTENNFQKDDRSKENQESIILNGTQSTGDSVEKDRPETSTTRKPKTELTNSENESEEKIEQIVNEVHDIQQESHKHQKGAQSKNSNSDIATEEETASTVFEFSTQAMNDDIDESFVNILSNNSKPLKKQQEIKSNLGGTKQTFKYKIQNKNIETTHEGENEALDITGSINTVINSQDREDHETVFHPEIILIEDTRQETVQSYNETIDNPIDLVIISSDNSNTKSLSLNETNATELMIHPDILVINNVEKETIDNPVELVIIDSKDSTGKLQDFNTDTSTVLEIQPVIFIMNDTKKEKTQVIFNEEKIDNLVDLVAINSMDSTIKSQDLEENTAIIPKIQPEILIDNTRQEKTQIYEDITNPIALKPIQIYNIEMQNSENKQLNSQNDIFDLKILEKNIVEETHKETEKHEELLQHQTSGSNSKKVAKNNLQNSEPFNTVFGQMTENPLTVKLKEDNEYEYILPGNEFIQLNNKEQLSGFNYGFDKHDSENKFQLSDSIMTMLENVQPADDKQQETFDTILEFLYKHSNNPIILSLKENLNSTISAN